MDKLIEKFITKHHVMTLATVDGDCRPHTANLFYAYDKANNRFVFTSSLSTRHGANMVKQSLVAANIVLETSKVGCIEGLQIEGTVCRAAEGMYGGAKLCYLKRFPFAVVADLELWVLEPTHYKLTDNKLGFGKKLIWDNK